MPFCKCGKGDVLEPKLTGGLAPSPELMSNAGPDEPEDGAEDKKKRKSLVSRAYAGAKRHSAKKAEAAQRWANNVSRQTQHFMAVRGWVGSISVKVGMGVVAVGVTLPVAGRAYLDLGRSAWTSGSGQGTSSYFDWGSLWDGDSEDAPDAETKAEENSKIPKALERMASALVAAKRGWPGGCAEGAAVTVCVDLTCYGVGIEIEAQIDIFSITLPDEQSEPPSALAFWACGPAE